jgi:hypothetical protein
MTQTSMYDTTVNGTRYKFVDTPQGQAILINGCPYKVGSACGYGSIEIEVAGFNIGGTSGDCEVWTDNDDEAEVQFKGEEDQCWDYVIDLLGSPNREWEGFEGDYYTDDGEFHDEDESEDESELED